MKNYSEDTLLNNPKFKASEISISYHPKMRNSERAKISCSNDCIEIIKPFFENFINYKEAFYVMVLNRQNRVLGISKISEGGISGTVVDPKIVFQVALKTNASSVILFHNHPSGNISPSQSDINLTRKLKEAGKYLELPILDHIILTDESYYSFADEGMI